MGFIYDRANAIKTATDWILVSANPNVDSPTRGTGHLLDQQKAQRAWALSKRQSYVNGYNIFHDFATGVARGWIEDDVHPSSAGVAYRNAHLWKVLPLGHYNLGAMGLPGPDGIPIFGYGSNTTGQIGTERTVRINNITALKISSDANPLSAGSDWRFRTSSGDLLIDQNGGAGIRLSNVPNYAGAMPVNDGDELGRHEGVSRTFNVNCAGFAPGVTAVTSANSPYTMDRYRSTVTLDATGGNVSVTLPAASASFMKFREYRIKRLVSDVSANTATITGTIDGIVNPTLAAGECWVIQSNGTVWFRLNP